MANSIAPSGFSVVKATGMYTGQDNVYVILQADTNQYGIGDAVKVAVGGDANGIAAVTKSAGTSGEFSRGVITGVLPVQAVGLAPLQGTPLALEIINVPATKTRNYYVFVNDDPNTIYEIADDGSTALTATACNKNALFTPTNNTNPLIQVSATVLAGATINTTAAFPLKILGLSQRPAGALPNTLGANAKWLVKFNNHDLNSASVAGV